MPTSSLLESAPVVHPSQQESLAADTLAATILDHLDEQTVISLDSLICLMPQYSWNQIFHTDATRSSFADTDLTTRSSPLILLHNPHCSR